MSDAQDRLLRIEDRGAARTLVLDRPHRRNALSDALLRSLRDALLAAGADDRVHSIVLTGAGPCFSSGRDQKDMGDSRAVLQDGSLPATVSLFTDVLRLLIQSPKPTVAAVRGYALAGGQALTLACDFVVAERGARFGNPEMLYGFPAAMNTVLLARHLGRRRALEIAITGGTFEAEAAHTMGLVNRLAEPGELEVATRAFTDAIDALAPWAVRRTKQLFLSVEDAGLSASLDAGDALNQLLRANAQLEPLFAAPDAGRDRLRGAVATDPRR